MLKKRIAKEVKEHFVDIWGDIKSSSELVQKLDDYEVARDKTSNHQVSPDVRITSFHSKINKQIRTVDKAKEEPRKSFRGQSQFESRKTLSCYGCGKPDYIKSKCPNCKPSKGDPAHFRILRINSLSPSNRNAVLKISINGVSGTAFADSGATHSIAGEILYTILLQQGAAFEKTVISLSVADGIVTQKEVLRTFQTVILEVRERIEEKQDQRKTYDKRHRHSPLYHPGDKVWLTLPSPLSNAAHKKTAKFMPKRDGPYIIVTHRSPTTYEVANPNNSHEVLGPYHSSVLRPCIDKEVTPVMPLRKKGRPRKDNSAGSSSRTIPRKQRGSVTNGNRAPSPGRMDK
ncbi:uncharacterized protein TNCV_4944851 [Trichonephila clavipes]|nr:uncharacterized protein TNCV_4944851 [Trichonephila clavipes]